jgi:hypothetical protein
MKGLVGALRAFRSTLPHGQFFLFRFREFFCFLLCFVGNLRFLLGKNTEVTK